MNKAELFWQTYRNLEKEVLDLSKYVSFTDNTTKTNKNGIKNMENVHLLETYSPYIADLLVRCCVEIESISKELYFDNGGSKQRGSNDIYFDTDCIDLIEQKWSVGNKIVIVSASNFDFKKNENIYLTPLKDANRRSKTYWAKAYQAVKHDRYNSLYRGNIKALLLAMAALYLLNIYYRDNKLTIKYTDLNNVDLSFGSQIFTLKIPSDQYLIDVINGKKIEGIMHSTDSPYILKYKQESYRKNFDEYSKELKEISEYLNAQPEFKEPDFIYQLQEFSKNNKQSSALMELAKYRLNKKIPKSLTFEERKRLFVNSNEWQNEFRLRNSHKEEQELTEENIQSEIDLAGMYAGIELGKKFTYKRFYSLLTDYCELVLDKGDVHY